MPAKYTGTSYWVIAAGLYVLAKVLEHFDVAIQAMLGVIGGHPIKHVMAACAAYAILLAFQTRRPVAG